MIILHQYPAAFNLPSLSPFCIKVEFFLKLARLPYEVKIELNPSRGPKGKMPFIEDKKQVIADSSFIIDHLIKSYRLDHFTVQDPSLAAQALAFKSMIEESLYFILLYSRWVDDTGYEVIKHEFTPLFPPFIGKPFLAMIRRNLKRQAFAQGLGRHTKQEVYDLGCSQLEALSAFLGERKFFFGNKLTVLDITCYAFLITILKQPIDSPFKRHLSKKTHLCEYIHRLDRLFENQLHPDEVFHAL